MYCKQCGAEINEDVNVCPSCGASQVEETVEVVETSNNADLENLSGEILKWGIMALAFAVAGVCVSFLGIIFGSKTSKLVKQYEAVAPLEGKAKVGQILGKIGFIAGIVMTVIWALYIVMFGCIACLGVAGNSYYY